MPSTQTGKKLSYVPRTANLGPGRAGSIGCSQRSHRPCLPARTTLRDGRVVSNIVAQHPAGTRITIPDHSVDWVATEHGAALSSAYSRCFSSQWVGTQNT